METPKITAAAVFAKKGGGIQIKIWVIDAPTENCTVELWNSWLSRGVKYFFKDDLQEGKFMWLAARDFQAELFSKGNFTFKSASKEGFMISKEKSYWDSFTESGVFLNSKSLEYIGFDGEKVFLKAIPAEKLYTTIPIFPAPATVSPKERLDSIAKNSHIEKTKVLTGKQLWQYTLIAALIGLVIGVGNGIVIGIILINLK